MNVPLSNEDIERALRGENGFRGVYSYDLLPNLKQGQFCVVKHRQRFASMGFGRGWAPLADGLSGEGPRFSV